MEFVQISGVGEVGSAEGMSYVVDDRDSSLTMFMPDQHTAMVTDMGAVLGSASAMRSGMTPKFTQHLTTNRMDDLGPGERILGHATHRYRLTTAGTMDVTIQGETCTKPVDAVSEMWMADDVDLMPVMQAMTKHFSAVGEVANMTQAASDAAKALPPGFPTKGTALRTVSRSTARGADGKTVPVTSTTEYVEMSQAPIPNSIFAVPSDYKVMDARKMMANLPAGVLDSSMTSTVAGMGESMKKAMCGPSR